MWKLTIEDDEGKRTPLPLVRDEYSIGRGEENTVRLTERNISRKHAVLQRGAGGWLILDTASYNGSYINSIRISSEYSIQEGDILQIGDYRLEFSNEDLAAQTSDPTKAATIPGGGPAAVKPDRLVVVVGPEPGEEFLIQSGSVTIGRAPELNICLPHSSVSRNHAEVHALGGGRYEILDKGSANGVRVNGSLLKRGLLEAGDFIELGEVKLKFVGAGQLYRPGADAVRLPTGDEPEGTARASGQPFGTAATIDGFIGEPGTRSKFAKNLLLGAGVGLIAVCALFVAKRLSSTDARSAVALPSSGPKVPPPPEPIDPAQVALDEAQELANKGDLELAHSRIALDVAKSQALRGLPQVREIEGTWADGVMARAGVEQDLNTRRMLLSAVAQASTVDPVRRRAAADKLREVEQMGTDVRELPQVRKANPREATPPREGAPPREGSPPRETALRESDPASAKHGKPVLAADPWAVQEPAGGDPSTKKKTAHP